MRSPPLCNVHLAKLFLYITVLLLQFFFALNDLCVHPSLEKLSTYSLKSINPFVLRKSDHQTFFLRRLMKLLVYNVTARVSQRRWDWLIWPILFVYDTSTSRPITNLE